MIAVPNENAPDAIMQKDPLKRLDAIIRRHGGKPVSIEPVDPHPRFPAIGRHHCVDQIELFEERK